MKKVKFYSLQIFIVTTLFFSLIITVSAQKQKTDKKIRKADMLYKKAVTLGDSAKHDSAVILLNIASDIYKKKGKTEKYLLSRNEIVKQYRHLKFKDEFIKAADANIKYAIENMGPKHYITGYSYNLKGNIFDDINQLDSALYYFNIAKEIWKNDPQINSLRIANANQNIGNILSKKGDFDKASLHFHISLKTKIDSLGEEHPDIADIYNDLGVMYYYKGSIDSCTFYLEKTLDVKKKIFGEYHPSLADGYNNIAVVISMKGDHKKALEYHHKALDIRVKTNHPTPGLALSYINIGVIHKNLGNYVKADEYYQEALNIRLKLFGKDHLDVANCYMQIGGNYLNFGKKASALLYTKKGFDIIINTYGEENPNSARAFGIMGMTYYNGFGDLDKALPYFLKCLDLSLKTDKNNPMIAGNYHNIGNVYMNRGDYETALSYYKSSLEIFKINFGEKHYKIANVYSNIGNVYSNLNDYKSALEYYTKVLRLNTELYGENYPESADTYLNIGSVYNKMGMFEEEYLQYKKGLEICLNNFDENDIRVSNLFLNISINQVNQNNYENAVSFAEKALKINREYRIEDHPDIAYSHINYAYLYTKFGKPELALKHQLTALDENYHGDITDTIEYHLIFDKILFLETLEELGSTYFKLYNEKNNIDFLENAINYYRKISDMVSYLSSGYSIEGSKINLLKETSNILQKGIKASEINYKLNQNDKKFSQAFRFCEQNKSTALYESIIKSKLNTDNLNDSLWVKSQDLTGKINYLKTLILSNESNKDSMNLNNKLDLELSKTIIELHSVARKIDKADDKLKYVVFYKENLINSIQTHIKSDEIILEYFLADSAVYCFIIGKDFHALKKVQTDGNFNTNLNNFISSIKKHRFDEFPKSSYFLYNILIKQAEEFIKDKSKLIIIPDGRLLYLPFSCLINEIPKNPENTNFSELNYLIKDFEIVYHYSAGLWLENQKKINTQFESEGFLGIAPFAFADSGNNGLNSNSNIFLDSTLSNDIIRNISNNDGYVLLKHSNKEIKEIGSMYLNNNLKVRNLINKDATEEKFKDISKHYKFIHIATHGIINNIHPELSGLAFNSKTKEDTLKNDSFSNGILYAKEIYDLELNADLVVLSACETGIGKLEKGEGIMSLTRGFLYKQVPNIVFSLWKINDKNSCDLMIDFYKNILQNRSYAASLRQAMLNMIKNKDTAFPSNWAAFSLIGN